MVIRKHENVIVPQVSYICTECIHHIVVETSKSMMKCNLVSVNEASSSLIYQACNGRVHPAYLHTIAEIKQSTNLIVIGPTITFVKSTVDLLEHANLKILLDLHTNIRI